jgi:hypothetical protein
MGGTGTSQESHRPLKFAALYSVVKLPVIDGGVLLMLIACDLGSGGFDPVSSQLSYLHKQLARLVPQFGRGLCGSLQLESHAI